MSFCPSCNTLLNITNKLTNFKKTNTVNIFIASTLLGDITNEFDITFNDEQLRNNAKFNNLPAEKQEIVIKKFDELNAIKKTKRYFICYRCGFNKLILSGTVLYKKNYSSQSDIFRNISLYKYNNTYPRTKLYVCKNDKCPSHTNNEIKEAILIKDKNTYELLYLCAICDEFWYASIMS